MVLLVSTGSAQVPGALFEDDGPIALTLEADWGAVFKHRDTLHPEYLPATLNFPGADGAPITRTIKIRTRGHWRLRPENCDFPPLLDRKSVV